MKTIKIILAVTVLAILTFLVWKWLVEIPPICPVKPPTIQFIERIESEIDSMLKAPINVFSNQLYEDILYRINDYHKQNFFGENETSNNQWKEILSKNLYSAYAPKFAEQAIYVFNGREWRVTDLNFIRSELSKLQSSSYLEKNSSVDESFKIIQIILLKYFEIVSFVSSCNGFSFSDINIDAIFPVDVISMKIEKSRTYVNNILENNYLKNCERLKDHLREIPLTLFNKHKDYLNSKILSYSERYSEFNNQLDYSNNIFRPLSIQLEGLDNNLYKISNVDFNHHFERLEELLKEDNRKAYEYYRSLINNEL